MKVLWFSVTPSLYDKGMVGHNGGGWISSLEVLVKGKAQIQLAVAFEHQDDFFRVKDNNVIYYPINIWSKSRMARIKRKFMYKTEEKLLVSACLKIIDDFEPDVIHVFGSEWAFGLIVKHIKIPTIIHMQGSIIPYYNARFPPGYNEWDFLFNNGFNLKNSVIKIINNYKFRLRAKREEEIFKYCKNFMGRTKWDKIITAIYANKSNYFHCDEAIRNQFIESVSTWKPHTRNKVTIMTTISPPLYKGIDVILKTALLLKERSKINFEWKVFGVKEINLHERKNKIKASAVNVTLMNVVTALELKESLLDSDVFIHTSYIDNSPNSICEAQILGIPVIATNVGGISSIVEHFQTGLLIPSNDPFTLMCYILNIINDKELATELGKRARKVAIERHNPEKIINDLVNIYNSVKNKS